MDRRDTPDRHRSTRLQRRGQASKQAHNVTTRLTDNVTFQFQITDCVPGEYEDYEVWVLGTDINFGQQNANLNKRDVKVKDQG